MASESVDQVIERLRAESNVRYMPWVDGPLQPLTCTGGMASVFDRAMAGFQPGALPDYVPPMVLVPDMPAASSPMPPLLSVGQASHVAKRVRAAREYADQQNAMDAPFSAIQREKWAASQASAGASACAERSDAQSEALGFTSNETSDRKRSACSSRRPPRNRLLVDPQAKRLKRMRSSVSHAARMLHFDAHEERHAQLWNKKFLTLTYADGGDWEGGHIAAFRKAMNHWCIARRVRLRFVWVAELQKRGAIHYHVIVWLPKGKYLPFADAQGWWPHGRTNIVNAQSPIGYITKYASKATAADALGYPKGARICGYGGLQPEGRRHLRYWNAPFWVRDELGGRADIRKVAGGYCNKLTGEFLPSPWRVEVGANGQVWAYRIDDQPMELAS